MNIGIICEFNPFHKGHKFLIDSVKDPENGIICCMSGNFVQRGEFAVYDKFSRARTAVENGADLVIELPAPYSTMSAEGFASSAVKLLESTGTVDKIAFGAECTDISKLKEIAQRLNDGNIRAKITGEMKNGISYPAARKKIIDSKLLDTPNNILAVEYLKAASVPCTAVKRIGKGHDSDDEEYSASAIRKKLDKGSISSMKNCEKAILAKLRTMSAEEFADFEDVSEGLENRIYNAVREACSLSELYNLIKTKRYTHSRIRRIILRAYLGIKNTPQEVPYIRILAFNSKGREILTEMKKSAEKPIVAKISDCSNDILPFFEEECKYTDLYNLGYEKPLPCGTEQRHHIVII